MSEQRYIIEVEPPRWTTETEKKEFHNFTCPNCNGGGGFVDELDKYTSCGRCDGTGKIMAEVIIKWRPDY